MLQCEEQSMFARAWRKRKHVSHQHGCNLRKAVASANYVIPQPHKVRSCFNSVSTHNLESWIILSETTETMHQVIHINEIKEKKKLKLPRKHRILATSSVLPTKKWHLRTLTIVAIWSSWCLVHLHHYGISQLSCIILHPEKPDNLRVGI